MRQAELIDRRKCHTHIHTYTQDSQTSAKKHSTHSVWLKRWKFFSLIDVHTEKSTSFDEVKVSRSKKRKQKSENGRKRMREKQKDNARQWWTRVREIEPHCLHLNNDICKMQTSNRFFCIFVFVCLFACLYLIWSNNNAVAVTAHALACFNATAVPFFLRNKKTNDKNIYTQFLFYSLSIVIMMMPQNIMTFLSSLSLSRSPSCFVFLTKDSFVHKL